MLTNRLVAVGFAVRCDRRVYPALTCIKIIPSYLLEFRVNFLQKIPAIHSVDSSAQTRSETAQISLQSRMASSYSILQRTSLKSAEIPQNSRHYR